MKNAPGHDACSHAFLAMLVAFLAWMFVAAGSAHAVGGDVLWQDAFDRAGGEDFATAVAASNGKVVVVGSTQSATGNRDLVVRSYDARGGTLLWQDVIDLAGGDDNRASVVMDEHRVVMVGSGVDSSGSNRAVVRTYDAQHGELLWEEQFEAGVTVSGLAMHGPHIVITGGLPDGRLSVRAYFAKTGALAWADESLPSGSIRASGTQVALHDRRAFVAASAGYSTGVGSLFRCLVRSYEASTGHLLWESFRDIGACLPNAVATGAKQVIVAGIGGSLVDEYVVQAFDATTGEFVWGDRLAGTPFANIAVAADTARRLTFVAGWVFMLEPQPSGEYFLVRAYDTATGELRWEDRFRTAGGCFCHALDLVVEKGRVFAVGVKDARFAPPDNVSLVRAYDASSGQPLWHDEFDSPALGYAASRLDAVAAQDGKVFVAGSAETAAGNRDLLLRTYDAK